MVLHIVAWAVDAAARFHSRRYGPAAQFCAGHTVSMAKAEAPELPEELAPPEIRYRKGEVHAPVGKLTHNLHVAHIVVETKQHRVQPRAKNTRHSLVGRPPGGGL